MAGVALTNHRLLASWGVTHRASIPYGEIRQVTASLATVEVTGAGVALRVTATSGALAAALSERRQRTSAPRSADASAPSEDDPAQLLGRLNELRKAGALTDQEFDAKKAELLARM